MIEFLGIVICVLFLSLVVVIQITGNTIKDLRKRLYKKKMELDTLKRNTIKGSYKMANGDNVIGYAISEYSKNQIQEAYNRYVDWEDVEARR